MEITLKLSKDFERCLEDLKKKYGEDFEYINGLHPSQLDFSEFLDKFVQQDTMADATIDPAVPYFAPCGRIAVSAPFRHVIGDSFLILKLKPLPTEYC